MLDLATHHVDLYRWLLGDDVVDCRARTASRQGEQDSALFAAVSRAGIALSGYFAHGPSRSHALTAHGTRGVLRLDLHRGRMTLLRNRRHGYGVRSHIAWPSLTDLPWRIRRGLQPSYNPSHRLCLQAFVQAVQSPSQRHPDLAGIEDGAAALRAVLSAEGTASGAGTGPVPM
jgi:predicted dehydrogenase